MSSSASTITETVSPALADVGSNVISPSVGRVVPDYSSNAKLIRTLVWCKLLTSMHYLQRLVNCLHDLHNADIPFPTNIMFIYSVIKTIAIFTKHSPITYITMHYSIIVMWVCE